MPATREQIRAVLCSPEFTDGEKYVVRMQYRHAIPAGNFEEKLWDLMCAADEDNLTLLGKAFPAEVHAMLSWRYGQLGTRIRKAGLDI